MLGKRLDLVLILDNQKISVTSEPVREKDLRGIIAWLFTLHSPDTWGGRSQAARCQALSKVSDLHEGLTLRQKARAQALGYGEQRCRYSLPVSFVVQLQITHILYFLVWWVFLFFEVVKDSFLSLFFFFFQ